MSTSVPVSFAQLYTAEVKAAYQREGSFLRRMVRIRSDLNAERVYFPKLGTGHATSKARHADIVPMNLEHTRVFADMTDAYAPEYLDDLDMAKTNIASLRQDYANASAWALGRETDSRILTSAKVSLAANTANEISQATSTFTLKDITTISKAMTNNDVPLDRRRVAVISPELMERMQNLKEVTSSDFTNQQILVSGTEPMFWMGFNWMVHTGVSDFTDSTGKDVLGYFWHMPSMGLGVARDIQTSVDWVPEKVAWLVNSWMSMGAVAIDERGVFSLSKNV